MTSIEQQPIISTHNLNKSFDGNLAVEDLSLSIPEGIIFGFIGPAGVVRRPVFASYQGYTSRTAERWKY
ncbi:MAG: hypothetical protein ACK2U0_13940 [Candidatus Promineifilaceae bacterium]|jgi:ABC-2 type transport system ATP-binding protein